LTGLALLPLAIISVGAYAYARRAVERSVMNHLESLVTTQKHRIQEVVRAHERMLRVIASSERLRRAAERVTDERAAHEPSVSPTDDLRQLLDQWRRSYPGFRNLAVLVGDGDAVASTVPDGGATGLVMGALPWSAAHMRVGNLLAELDLGDLVRITSDYTGMGDTGETVLAARQARDGHAVYLTGLRFARDAALRRVVSRDDRRVAIARAMRGEEGRFVDTLDYRGVPVFSATAYLAGQDWGIVVKIDREEALAPLRWLAQGLALVFAVACLAVVAVGYLFTRRITAPIARLTRVAEAIDRGDLSQRVTVAGRDEIGLLGQALNRMIADLVAANTRLEERVRDRTAALEREMVQHAQAEHRFQLAFEQGLEAMVMVDHAGRIAFANTQLLRVFGYEPGEIVGRDWDVLFPERVRPTVRALRAQLLAGTSANRVETALQLSGETKDGHELPVDVGLSLVEVAEGALVLAVIRDLRERRRAEVAQALLAAVVDSAHDAIFSIDTDMRITTWNAGAEDLYGYRAEEILGQPVSLLWPPQEIEAELLTIRLLMEERRAMHQEGRRRRKDGSLIDVSLTRSPIRTPAGTVLGLSTIARDITARKRADEAMRASLHEKEVLLKEIHHRVKNNLQIVTSLLNLQVGDADDARFATLMRETQHRVKSMALMHETLYRSGNLGALDLREYVQELVDYLRHSYGPVLRRVTLRADVESLALPIDSAIPCGLVLTELVSNAFKHAFPDPMTGTLRVVGHHESSGSYLLRVVDDGRGMPPDVDPLRSRSLGLQLVTNLARQLHADFTRDDVGRGTSFSLRFASARPALGAAADPAA
jgi:PAS domain S-box-containing protein